MRRYTGISTFKEYPQRAGIDEVEYNGHFFGIRDELDKRVFCISYLPKRPVFSAISNIHELRHGLQKERQVMVEVRKNFTSLPNFQRLEAKVKASRGLVKRRFDFMRNTHGLNFYKSPDVRKLAQESGMDISAYDAFLAENVPFMTLIQCYCEGDAHVMEPVITPLIPQLEGQSLVLDMYILSAYIDCLLAHAKSKMQKVYWVGTGIAEYIRNHPPEKDAILGSKEFQKQLTDDFFTKK
ncbi:MAG TPA: hypothetical protein VFF28_07865 [Candidatus Nanoarchaeia archaeon]|nr:hypothetical protein [Candidatus Nanoarchaeia archaeon]